MEALERIIATIRQYLSSAQVSNAPAAAVDLVNSSISNVKLLPLTRDNILYYYMPIQGLASYTALSVSIMNPHIIMRICPKRDYTNILLLGAGGGAGLWLWSRPHFAVAAPGRRFSWSCIGATLWSLGSILLWAILRRAIGRGPYLCTVIGVASGAVITHAAVDYIHYVEVMFGGYDPTTKKNPTLTPSTSQPNQKIIDPEKATK